MFKRIVFHIIIYLKFSDFALEIFVYLFCRLNILFVNENNKFEGCMFVPLYFRSQKYIWHGSTLKGELDLSAYCNGWKSNSSSHVGLASSLTKHQLLSQERMGCNNYFAVLCVEVVSEDTHSLSRQRRSTSATMVDGQPKISGVRTQEVSATNRVVSSEGEDYSLLTPQDLEDLLKNLDLENALAKNKAIENRSSIANDLKNNIKEEKNDDKPKEEKKSWWFW